MADSKFFSAIVFCPLCCSQVDVMKSGVQELDCGACGQTWTMDVDPDRVAAHSLL